MTDEPEELDNLLDDVTQASAKKARALSLLLDERLRLSGHHIALPVRMGSTTSYVVSVSLDWIRQNIQYARNLPIFKAHRKRADGPITINHLTVEEIRQREPDFRRQAPMTLYLAMKKSHKFPPLLVVAYQEWVDDPDSPYWGPGR